jgi:hypothetical protein
LKVQWSNSNSPMSRLSHEKNFVPHADFAYKRSRTVPKLPYHQFHTSSASAQPRCEMNLTHTEPLQCLTCRGGNLQACGSFKSTARRSNPRIGSDRSMLSITSLQMGVNITTKRDKAASTQKIQAALRQKVTQYHHQE